MEGKQEDRRKDGSGGWEWRKKKRTEETRGVGDEGRE